MPASGGRYVPHKASDDYILSIQECGEREIDENLKRKSFTKWIPVSSHCVPEL